MRLIQPLLLGSLACLNAAGAAETVKSPDGKVVATVEVQDGQPRRTVASGVAPDWIGIRGFSPDGNLAAGVATATKGRGVLKSHRSGDGWRRGKGAAGK